MPILYFSDILNKAGIDPAKVKLIRHNLNNAYFKECYDAGMVYDYTCHQTSSFSTGFDYWAVFLSSTGTYARFFALYRVGSYVPDTPDTVPEGLPLVEGDYQGNYAVYDLTKDPVLAEYEGKLMIDWGKGRIWHQKGTNEKPVISIAPDSKKVFTGFENLVLKYDELKEIIDDEITYDTWHTALKSIYAIYLIVDTKTGQPYVGSAYGKDGLFGRWSTYVHTLHGGNKKMKELLKNNPERYHSFQFSVLQILPKTLTNDDVIEIEQLWKKKLLSAMFGMNDQ